LIALFNPLYAGIHNGCLKKLSAAFWKISIFGNYFEKSIILLEANKLAPRSGPTHVGPKTVLIKLSEINFELRDLFFQSLLEQSLHFGIYVASKHAQTPDRPVKI